MSNLIQNISENMSSDAVDRCKENVAAMIAQECSHLIMIAFDEMK